MNYKKLLGAASAALMIVIVIFTLMPGAWAQSNYKTLYKFRQKVFSSASWKLTLDAAGNLYGAACYGGAYLKGSIFKLAPNPDGEWTKSPLHEFTGGADGSCPNGTMIFDAAGNLYSTANSGGANGTGNVFELTPHPDGR